MSILLSIIMFLSGTLLLYFGGNQIVKGSVLIAEHFNIPKLIIGLTIVAMGTSMPEFFVSLSAMIKGSSDIAVGNVIGSNIFNIVFILGITSFLSPIKSEWKSFKLSMIVVFIVYIVFTIAILNFENFGFRDGVITPIEGSVIFAIFLAYIIYLYKILSSNKENIDHYEKEITSNIKNEKLIISILRVVVSILALYFGADLFIKGSVSIFSRFLSEHVIGIIVVAVGTSIPEFVTSFIASTKKEDDISVGNIIGSNIFNIGAVLGLVSILGFKRGGITLSPNTNYVVDIFIMFLSALLLFIFMRHNKTLRKTKGAILLVVYVGYVIFLVQYGSVK